MIQYQPDQPGEFADVSVGLGPVVAIDKRIDRIQTVENKMRVHLRTKGADLEFIQPESMTVVMLEAALSDFAARHGLSWSVQIFRSVVLLHLVASYRMGPDRLSAHVVALMAEIVASTEHTVRYSQKVSA